MLRGRLGVKVKTGGGEDEDNERDSCGDIFSKSE